MSGQLDSGAARVDRLSGDPGAGIAREEEDEAGGVLRQTDPTKPRLLTNGCFEVFGHPAGVGASWVDGVDGDAFGGHTVGQ
jgi:hypothetical protein